jgi:hypothetical protein
MSFSLIRPDIRGILPCPHCPCNIVLPFPKHESKPEDRDVWPNGRNWLYIACPECRYVYGHAQCQNEVLPRNQPIPHADKIVLRISYRCTRTTCGVPVQFHILEDATVTETTERELRDLLTSGYWTGVCPCGHSIGLAANQKVFFDRMGQETLQGYNRADRFWQQF